MATHPDLDDIDAILDAMEAEEGQLNAETKRSMRAEYIRQCGRLMRDPQVLRAVESGRRQSRRLRVRDVSGRRNLTVVEKRIRQLRKAPKKMRKRVTLRVQTSILPGLVVGASARQVEDEVANVSQAAGERSESDEEELREAEDEQSESEEEEEEELPEAEDEEAGEELREGGGLGGDLEDELRGAEEEEEEEGEGKGKGKGKGKEKVAVGGKGKRRSLSVVAGKRGNGGGGLRRSRAGRLQEYDRILHKIRVLAHIEPWRHEQAVVEVARQMRDMNLLLPGMDAEETGGAAIALTWAEVDKVLAIAKDRRMWRGQTDESSRSKASASGSSSGRRGLSLLRPSSSSSPPARLDGDEEGGDREEMAVPVNRAEVFGIVMSGFLPELSLDDSAQQLLVQKLQAAERVRVNAAVSFIRELGPDIPVHAAAERVLEVSEMSTAFRQLESREVRRSVSHLEKRTCEYNCGAMVKSLERLMRLYTCGMLLSAMAERSGDEPLVRVASKFNELARDGLAVIDYLNQGMKVSAKVDRGLLD
jgi:hypothetical protein